MREKVEQKKNKNEEKKVMAENTVKHTNVLKSLLQIHAHVNINTQFQIQYKLIPFLNIKHLK